MFRAAGTANYRELLTTANGLEAVTGWILRIEVLEMYSLARAQLYGTKLADQEADFAK